MNFYSVRLNFLNDKSTFFPTTKKPTSQPIRKIHFRTARQIPIFIRQNQFRSFRTITLQIRIPYPTKIRKAVPFMIPSVWFPKAASFLWLQTILMKNPDIVSNPDVSSIAKPEVMIFLSMILKIIGVAWLRYFVRIRFSERKVTFCFRIRQRKLLSKKKFRRIWKWKFRKRRKFREKGIWAKLVSQFWLNYSLIKK